MASIRVGKTTWPTILESLKKAWKVVAQQRAELVGNVLPVPDRVLLRTCQHSNRLNELRVNILWLRLPLDVGKGPKTAGSTGDSER